MHEHLNRNKLRRVQQMRKNFLKSPIPEDSRSWEMFDALERHAFHFALQEAELSEWGNIPVQEENASTGQIWANMALRRMMSDFLKTRKRKFAFPLP
jgi:hypothetical protein